jgi:endonuclease/exonuclease/phosphatase family metal-dependent hydrolase
MAALDLDVVGLQELRRWPSQARWIAGELDDATLGSDARHSVHRTPKTGPWGLWEEIAVVSRLAVLETTWLDLGGQNRVAQHVRVVTPGGEPFDFYNTHLATGDDVLRSAQARRILSWMEARPGTAKALVGDFNASPRSATARLLRDHLRSAYAAVHGQEPARTVPTPLRAPDAKTGTVIDYVFVSGEVEVLDAAVAFHQSHPADPRLVPSDHFGLVASVSFGPS